jgi:CRISPR-associated protein Cas1
MTMISDDVARANSVPELIPVRMLNEFAYCPRLAYIEWVQGEFADNLETHEGRFAHRRVDRPTRGEVPEPAAASPATANRSPKHTAESGAASDARANAKELPAVAQQQSPSSNGHESIHTRSLMLSAPRVGLIAKMDLVDVSAAEAVPVDYKRGRVPDVPGGAWEPEQVQLCAQGLILRENGYHCDGGFLYFVDSKRRVSIPFDQPLVSRTLELIEAMRAVAASGTIPPPLDDSPKCPRCSLVGICLPDETSLLHSGPRRARPKEVRRLLPARDTALPLYLQEQGTSLGKSGDELTVKQRGRILQKARLIDVSQVCLFGNVQVSAQAIREITARGIPLCHFSYGGWFHAITTGMTHKNVELRIAQFAAAADPGQSLALAKAFVVGKIRNGRTLLRRHLPDDPHRVLPKLKRMADRAEAIDDAQKLLGIEGIAAKAYFPALASLLKGDHAFSLDGRNRRPPRDPVNAVLSFVYALLTKELTLAVQACGFDPMLGFFHRPRYGRPSLALDLAEEFRPLVADSVVLTMINNRELDGDSFIRRAGAVALTAAGRRAVLSAFERRMDTLVTHPLFGYRVSYRRILEVQARLLARTLTGEIEQYPNFCTR